MSRITVSPEQMHKHYQTWQKSGLSKKEFCNTQNLPYQIFIYWSNKFNDSAPEQSGFIPVKIANTPGALSAKSTSLMEIVFPCGTKICFNNEVSPSYLRSLIG